MSPLRLAPLLCMVVALSSCDSPSFPTADAAIPHWLSGTKYLNEDLPQPTAATPSVSSSSDEAAKDYFTLGSSMDHVAHVMGTPTRTTDVGDEVWWYYKYSQITFKRGRVAEWSNLNNNLKIKLATSSPQADYFTQGSTTDQVIAVMGTPTRTATIGDELWWYYRYSQITFKHGRVSEWSNTSNNLKVRWNDSSDRLASSSEDSLPLKTSPYGSSIPSATGGTYLSPKLPSPSSRSYLYTPSFSDGYVDPHYRSGGYVRGYTRRDGTYVSPHYRSGGSVRGFSR